MRLLINSSIIMSVVFASILSKQSVVRSFSPSIINKNVGKVISSSSTTIRYMSTPTTPTTPSPPPMPYDDEKMPFYALGTNLAIQVGGQGNFNTLLESDEMDIVLEAFCDTIKGTTPIDSRTILTTYGPILNKILTERTSKLVDRVKEDGIEYITNFLDCNEEAIKTDSGLVYYEMTLGNGKQPNLQSNVEVHYHGTLTDGTVFDSSVDRGQTISFPLAGVIKGWQEGLQMMKEGGKATLIIPEDLAYGEAGSGEVIPPGATLKFEVELFKVDN